ITSGHKPASTTAEFEKYSMLSEDAVNKYAKAEDMVENIIEDFRSTRDLTIRAIRLAQDEGDDALEDTLIAFKNDLDKNIWMLQAFIGKEALEDDDAFDEDED
ncbi:ferritin-like domain-containing protein, partial [Aerococcus sp. L_32]